MGRGWAWVVSGWDVGEPWVGRGWAVGGPWVVRGWGVGGLGVEWAAWTWVVACGHVSCRPLLRSDSASVGLASLMNPTRIERAGCIPSEALDGLQPTDEATPHRQKRLDHIPRVRQDLVVADVGTSLLKLLKQEVRDDAAKPSRVARGGRKLWFDPIQVGWIPLAQDVVFVWQSDSSAQRRGNNGHRTLVPVITVKNEGHCSEGNGGWAILGRTWLVSRAEPLHLSQGLLANNTK